MNCKLQTAFVGSYELRGLIKTPYLCGVRITVYYTSLPSWGCRFDSDTPLPLRSGSQVLSP